MLRIALQYPPSFADLDAALAALPPTARRARPSRPVLNAVSEARRLQQVAAEHREAFATLPRFELAALDQLAALAERLEYAELEFWQWKGKKKEGSLTAARTEAFRLRSALVAASRHALRESPNLLVPLEGYRQRRSRPGLVGDLMRLASLYDAHAGAFADAGGLPERPADAARRAAEALLDSPRDARSQVRGKRNAAFALLMLAVNEVRAGGRFLFRYEPAMLARFKDRGRREGRRRANARSSRAAAS